MSTSRLTTSFQPKADPTPSEDGRLGNPPASERLDETSSQIETDPMPRSATTRRRPRDNRRHGADPLPQHSRDAVSLHPDDGRQNLG